MFLDFADPRGLQRLKTPVSEKYINDTSTLCQINVKRDKKWEGRSNSIAQKEEKRWNNAFPLHSQQLIMSRQSIA